ncbi:MAG: PspA/IM30 family protein [Anaerolineales bacterium]
MASILEKVQTLISANLHSLVDRALESNSLKVMDEYIRQAERNLDALEDSAATVGGTVKTLKRKYDEFSAQVEKLDRDIDTLLMKNKTDLAMAAQADLNSKTELAQEYYEQWQHQDNEYKKLMDAKLKLEQRLVAVKQEREHLKSLLELAEAKQVTTKTIRSLDDVANAKDDDIRVWATKSANGWIKSTLKPRWSVRACKIRWMTLSGRLN